MAMEDVLTKAFKDPEVIKGLWALSPPKIFHSHMDEQSTFYALYTLWKDFGMSPCEAFLEAIKEILHSRKLKRIIRDGQNPRKMNTERFYNRLKNRPKLFE